MRYSSYELKYCERCGGLGLRRSRTNAPYCCDCEQMLQAFQHAPQGVTETSAHLRRIVRHPAAPTLVPSGKATIMQEVAHVS